MPRRSMICGSRWRPLVEDVHAKALALTTMRLGMDASMQPAGAGPGVSGPTLSLPVAPTSQQLTGGLAVLITSAVSSSHEHRSRERHSKECRRSPGPTHH
ncbi:hypothetical protein Vretimale_8937 [Volvox reticuliferus]|uniref:Uncharacterized protein n=1 Tax=Volvox reticuliferus TaxID=1737510 RepID=A0A8J4LNU4_9CHLO|nr:hypothetical protein Vretimale_8937 [Volvox reticuliferus]